MVTDAEGRRAVRDVPDARLYLAGGIGFEPDGGVGGTDVAQERAEDEFRHRRSYLRTGASRWRADVPKQGHGTAGDHAPGLIDALRLFVKQLLRLRREVRGRVQPQRHAHVLAGRDEECLPVGGIVLQQLMVFDMGNIPPAELLTLAVELIRQAKHGEQRSLDPDLYRLAGVLSALPDEKPPEMSRRNLQRGSAGHRSGTIRPVLASASRSNPRSERYSNTFFRPFQGEVRTTRTWVNKGKRKGQNEVSEALYWL